MTTSNGNEMRLDCSSAAGAPTLTTPTLTPTTLRNIEQMFLEASSETVEQPVVHQNAAHFVPPPIMELPDSVKVQATPPPLPGEFKEEKRFQISKRPERCLESV